MEKMLIVYYSWSNGNTEGIAKQLQAATEADMVRIDTVESYLGGYDHVVAQGQDEVERGYQPPIRPFAVGPENYHTIAVGTPTWWYTMAPAMLTFLNSHDWEGKTVIPFATNGGWPGHVIEDIKAACKGATFIHEMEIQFDSTGGDRLETPKEDILAWVGEIKLAL